MYPENHDDTSPLFRAGTVRNSNKEGAGVDALAQKKIQRVVVKVGSNTLTTADKALDRRYIAALVDQLGECVHAGIEIVLVTSGAIAAGCEVLGWHRRPADMAGLQAAASVGQVALIEAYATEFGRRQLNVGQVLLTRGDLEDETSYQHAHDTFERLLAVGALAVVNENDTVAVEEICFGDNDALAALVGVMLCADMVVILTDVDGLYEENPRTYPQASRIERICGSADERLARITAGSEGSGLGSGGMKSKLEAACRLADVGVTTVLCDGRAANAVVDAVLDGRPHGTVFVPDEAEV
jgi:glutamate 5-kinase